MFLGSSGCPGTLDPPASAFQGFPTVYRHARCFLFVYLGLKTFYIFSFMCTSVFSACTVLTAYVQCLWRPVTCGMNPASTRTANALHPCATSPTALPAPSALQSLTAPTAETGQQWRRLAPRRLWPRRRSGEDLPPAAENPDRSPGEGFCASARPPGGGVAQPEPSPGVGPSYSPDRKGRELGRT